MKIYKYAMTKYIKSPSTWIIIGIAVLISFLIGGFLPFIEVDTGKPNAVNQYAHQISGIATQLTLYLSIFSSIFVGFKASQMFRDEVENGVFLVVLSKPVTRLAIIFFRWLALQTIILIFVSLSILAFIISGSLFDVGDEIHGLEQSGIETLKDNIWNVGLIIFGIVFLISLIFSSIAILISTWMSSGATIGISIAIGVIVPVTALTSAFTAKPEYQAYNKNVSRRGITRLEKANEYFNFDDASINEAMNDMNGFYDELLDKETGFSNIGFYTGDTDTFKYVWPVNFNYQFSLLGTYARDEIISKEYSSSISDEGVNAQMTRTRDVINEIDIDSFKSQIIELFSNLSSTRQTTFNLMLEGINQLMNDPEIATNYKPVQINYSTLSLFETRYGYNLVKDVTDGNITAINNPTNRELTVFSIDNFEAVKNIINSMFNFFRNPIDAEIVLYKDADDANATPFKVVHKSSSQPISSLDNDSFVDANGDISIDAIYSHAHDEDYFIGNTDFPGSAGIVETLLWDLFLYVKESLFTEINNSEGLEAYEDL